MSTEQHGGSPDVPPYVAVVRDFVNTTDRETGTDEIDSAVRLTRYLHAAGLLPRRTPSTTEDLALAHQLRLGLRRALELNHDRQSQVIPVLDATLARLPVELRWAGDAARLVPARTGIPGALSQIALAMNRAIADDVWHRLKICWSDECEWAYFDGSKNRSRNWCEYGCGNRAKVRAYRARKRAVSP